jgi:hypothetical protein
MSRLKMCLFVLIFGVCSQANACEKSKFDIGIKFGVGSAGGEPALIYL